MQTCWVAAGHGYGHLAELNLPRSWSSSAVSSHSLAFAPWCWWVVVGMGLNCLNWVPRVCTRVCKAEPGHGLGEESEVLCWEDPSSPHAAAKTGLWGLDLPWGPSMQSHHLWTPPRCRSTAGLAIRLALPLTAPLLFSPRIAFTQCWECSGAEVVPLSRPLAAHPLPIHTQFEDSGKGRREAASLPPSLAG